MNALQQGSDIVISDIGRAAVSPGLSSNCGERCGLHARECENEEPATK